MRAAADAGLGKPSPVASLGGGPDGADANILGSMVLVSMKSSVSGWRSFTSSAVKATPRGMMCFLDSPNTSLVTCEMVSL